MFWKPLFHIGKPLLEYPDTVTDDRVVIDWVGGDLNDVSAIDLELLAGPRVLTRHPTHLVEQMGTHLAGVGPNEDLDLGLFVVTLDPDRRKTGSRLVFNGSPTALCLISSKINQIIIKVTVDHDLTWPDVGSQVD